MSYSLNRGVDGDGLDNTQRGLLIGLPAIALILGFGAFHKQSPSGQVSASTIPVVSSLRTSGGSNGNGSSANNTPTGTGTSATDTSGSATGAATAGSASTGVAGGTVSTTSGGTASGGVVGGRGGGPTTGGGTGGTTVGGGGTTIPTCSLNQVATVNCMVPACSPAVTLAPGQKAILGVAGTCVVLN
jgi:hypothetical protein